MRVPVPGPCAVVVANNCLYMARHGFCIAVLVQHLAATAQDFLNGVCTHIIWLTKKKLTYYTGNYDTFRKTVRENEVIQMKKYHKEQDDIKHLKEFIASCGTYSNLVKQARRLLCQALTAVHCALALVLLTDGSTLPV